MMLIFQTNRLILMSDKISLTINFKDRNISDKEFLETQKAQLSLWAEAKGLKVDSIAVQRGSIILGVEFTPLMAGTLTAAGGIVVFAFKAIAQDIIVQYWKKLTGQNNNMEITNTLTTEQIKKIACDINDKRNLVSVKTDDFNEMSMPISWKSLNQFENVEMLLNVEDEDSSFALNIDKSSEYIKIDISIRDSLKKKILK